MTEPQDDLSLLQGRWQQIAYERDGKAEPVDQEKGWSPVTEILGETFSVTIASGETVLKGVFRIDPSCMPKAIDWIDKSGSYASEQPIKAIYTLTEREFVFCAAYDGQERPGEFKTMAGQVLRKMHRVSS